MSSVALHRVQILSKHINGDPCTPAPVVCRQATTSPAGMRAVVTGYGENALEGVSEFIELIPDEFPEPSELLDGDVVIAVESAAIAWVDLIMASGQYQHQAQPPYTPGLEYAGKIVWAGKNVTSKHIGERVFVDCFSAGPRTKGRYQKWGGAASFAVAPASAARPIPPSWSYDEACCFAGAYETAYHCLVTCGKLQAGETVLIHGASGATGLAAVHLAKALGATVIATGRSRRKNDVVLAQGADHVVVSSENGEAVRFRDEVKRLTGGKGVDVVYDAVGGPISLESLRCVKFGARFLIVGWASTPNVAQGGGRRGAPNVNSLPTNLIMMKGLQVLGCPAVIALAHNPGLRTRRVAALDRLVESGSLRPLLVSHAFPLSKIKEALLARWNGEVIGGCVVNPRT